MKDQMAHDRQLRQDEFNFQRQLREDERAADRAKIKLYAFSLILFLLSPVGSAFVLTKLPLKIELILS